MRMLLVKTAVQGLCAGIGIGLVLLLGGQCWRPAPAEAQADARVIEADVIRAKTLIVQGAQFVDANGGTYARIYALEEEAGGIIELIDGEGSPRVRLVTHELGSGVYLGDAQGAMRAAFQYLPGPDAASLLFYNRAGQPVWRAP